ncbi:UbiA family prenyltransferase [Pengzhenrongella frigida]|uniref:UbiA family prenyltransferase n=1 Tax=Pengzhenrongella frigida TaxID=1259133 RepID=UPI001F5C920C|nr:UbiA family prenyltransferase [Cellulomonas sp. HLT2-17]
MTVRRLGHTIGALARSCHLGPTLAVTALTTALALGVGADARTCALICAAILTGQLSVGWSNDWIDAARDAAVGRQDKPIVGGSISTATVRTAALIALACCVPLSLATGWRAGIVHLAAVAAAWAYNLGLKSTAWSWAPYAFSFGLLPAFVALALPGHPWPAGWAVSAAALLGVGAHLANVVPDLDDDRSTGVRGLPHRLGGAGSSLLAPAVLLGATVLIVLGPVGSPSAAAWPGLAAATVIAVVGAVVALTRARSRVPFYLTIAVAAVNVLLLVGAGPRLV